MGSDHFPSMSLPAYHLVAFDCILNTLEHPVNVPRFHWFQVSFNLSCFWVGDCTEIFGFWGTQFGNFIRLEAFVEVSAVKSSRTFSCVKLEWIFSILETAGLQCHTDWHLVHDRGTDSFQKVIILFQVNMAHCPRRLHCSLLTLDMFDCTISITGFSIQWGM
jgi:hypothetical protein